MTLGDRPRPSVGDQSAQAATESRPKGPFWVDLGNGNMGELTPRFNLSKMFLSALGHDFNRSGEVVTVYIRTRLGNIHRLNSRGLLVDGNESKKWKSPVVVHLDPYEMGDAEDILTGTDFRYPSPRGGIRHTNPVTEIVVTSASMKSDPEKTQGRTSSIVADFYDGLPEIPGEQSTYLDFTVQDAPSAEE